MLSVHCSRCGCCPYIGGIKHFSKSWCSARREITEAFRLAKNGQRCICMLSSALLDKAVVQLDASGDCYVPAGLLIGGWTLFIFFWFRRINFFEQLQVDTLSNVHFLSPVLSFCVFPVPCTKASTLEGGQKICILLTSVPHSAEPEQSRLHSPSSCGAQLPGGSD